jgi:hypothetical protein
VIGDFVEVIVRLANFVVVMERRAEKAFAKWLQRNHAFALVHDDPTEGSYTFSFHRLADHRKCFGAYVVIRHDVVTAPCSARPTRQIRLVAQDVRALLQVRRANGLEKRANSGMEAHAGFPV